MTSNDNSSQSKTSNFSLCDNSKSKFVAKNETETIAESVELNDTNQVNFQSVVSQKKRKGEGVAFSIETRSKKKMKNEELSNSKPNLMIHTNKVKNEENISLQKRFVIYTHVD